MTRERDGEREGKSVKGGTEGLCRSACVCNPVPLLLLVLIEMQLRRLAAQAPTATAAEPGERNG